MDEIINDIPEFYNKHYITVDEQNRIVNGFSDAFRQSTDTDICINEQGGYQFRLSPGGEENPPLHEFEHMIPLYKYENGKVVERTEEEIAKDLAALPVPEPTWNEQMEEHVAELEAINAELEDAMCEMDAANQEEIAELQETTAALEDAICEMDEANDERMAAIEDALCEMDMG